MRRLFAAIGLACAALACGPRSIADAEKKGDEAWLDKRGTPDALAALGRLADKDPRAAAALEKRGDYDRDVYAAAWSAVLRGAPWGSQLYTNALGDPSRAELAASTLPKKDPHLAAFVPALESALSRLGASMNNIGVASALASAGDAAKDAITRRLADGATRGAMCRGLATSDATPDARKILTEVPAESRNNEHCLDAVVKIATDDADMLQWLGASAEPGLLSAASKNELFACAKLHDAWVRALAARGTDRGLVVPLKHAVHRCPGELDGVLADSIARAPATAAVIVDAIEPYDSYKTSLRATCAALPHVVHSGAPAITRERASRALDNACKR